MAMPRAQEIEGYARDGMARAIWVHAYMMWATEVEPPPMMHGDTWESVAPNTAASRRASGAAAEELADLIGEMNHLGGRPLAEIFSAIRFQRGGGATDADRAYALGSDLAHVCMGTLDRQDSLLSGTQFQMPHLHAELSDDGHELTWDGGAEHRNPGEGPPAILHLEDDPRMVTGTTRWLKKIFKDIKDVRIVPADNVDAAIANVGVHNVRLIISDVDVLGNKSGIDFFHWIRENRPDLVDRFVFFTGNSVAEHEHYRYLPKGVATAEDLAATIKAPGPGARAEAAPTRAPARATKAPPKTLPIVDLAMPRQATGLEGIDMPIDQFAVEIKAILPTIPAEPGLDDPRRARGRFGDRKVFIDALMRRLGTEPRFSKMTRAEVKERLLEAMRARLLQLARADLVAAMDVDEVANSETETADGGATYHFVIDEPRDVARPHRAPATVGVDDFSSSVLDIVKGIRPSIGATGLPRGRFGPNKVFIGSVWRRASQMPFFSGMTREEFNRRLIAALRDSSLLLARADSVGDMDTPEVMDSEITDRGASFHFIIDPSVRGFG